MWVGRVRKVLVLEITKIIKTHLALVVVVTVWKVENCRACEKKVSLKTIVLDIVFDIVFDIGYDIKYLMSKF